MTSRALLCVLLLAASTTVAAREVSLAGPNGGGGKIDQCQEISNAVEEATAKVPAKPRTTATATQQRKPAKPAPVARAAGDDEGSAPRVPTPRWHSFLPGMFR
jgi:hypothetical protein